MQNIILCGFMGCGKTTIGKKLSEKLGLTFVNTDDLIEEREKMPISEIFRLHGEPYFRDVETKICRETAGKQGQLISVGGGTFERQENIRLFRQKQNTILFLNTPFEVCYNRIKGDASRPVADGKSREQLLELYHKRYAQYMASSDLMLTPADLESLMQHPQILEKS